MATGVAELGVAVYDALEWTLSAELENVLDVMTDLEILDEGIGEWRGGSHLQAM